MKKEPSERIGRYVFTNIRPIGLRVLPAVNPIPQEARNTVRQYMHPMDIASTKEANE